MIFFTLLSLFFGLAAPFSFFTLFINSIVFGLLSQAQIKNYPLKNKIAAWLFLGLGYGAVYVFQTDIQKAIGGLAIFSLTYWIFQWLNLNFKQLVSIVFLCLFIGFTGIALEDGAHLRIKLSQETSPPFMTDMHAYLNTINLYKKTGNYYQSFAISVKGLGDNYGTDRLAGEIWGWKQPLIFTLWKILPGSTANVQWLGVAVFGIALIFVYKIARVFLPPQKALIAPFLVWPYLRYPLVEMTLLQVEWWALALFLLGFVSYMLRRFWFAGIFFALTLAVRELFAIPILGLVAIEFLRKRLKIFFILILPAILVFAPYYYFYHLQNVFTYETFDLFSGEILRLKALSGWEFVRTTLAYSSWGYALMRIRPFLLLLFINSIGLFFLIVYGKKRWRFLGLLTSFVLFFLLSFKIGIMDVWHDYWGIYYIPMLLLATPIVFHSFDIYFQKIFKKLLALRVFVRKMLQLVDVQRQNGK